MRASLSLLALSMILGCGESAESVRGVPGSQSQSVAVGNALRELCGPSLSALPVDAELGDGERTVDVVVASHASGAEDCSDYAWARGSIEVAALVEPVWAGPEQRASAWDCNHSTLEYAVYRRRGEGFEYAGGGLAFGSGDGAGGCTYSVSNPPAQLGTDSATVLAGGGDQLTEVRVGVRAWSHNDPAMGHAGHECAGTSCYWPVLLKWRGY
jgi:hypothetical protein